MKLCGHEITDHSPFFLIAGACVIESETMETAEHLKIVCGEPLIYKSSFDKANRSSGNSYLGPGVEEGLRVLDKVKRELEMPVLTDVHEDTPLDAVSEGVSVLQTPAFLAGGATLYRMSQKRVCP